MSIAFFFTALATMPSLFDIIIGLFSFKATGDSLFTIIGLVGTTIVPYNLFLHAELVKEKWTYPSDLKHALKDLIISLKKGLLITELMVSSINYSNGDLICFQKNKLELEPLLNTNLRLSQEFYVLRTHL